MHRLKALALWLLLSLIVGGTAGCSSGDSPPGTGPTRPGRVPPVPPTQPGG
jgi:hypothetical protein